MQVENISIKVGYVGVDAAANRLNSLATALQNVQNASASISGLANLTTLANAVQSISKSYVSVNAFNGLSKGIEKLSIALKGITSYDVNNLRNIASALSSLNGLSLGNLGTANLSRTVESLNGTANGISNVKSEGKAAAGVNNAVATSFDNVGKAAQKANSPIANFISSLKRIAFYRMIRSIIKAITQAFKEGLENAYEWSRKNGGELAASLDRIASASQKMKNQMGAAFGQLLMALEPIIMFLIQIITKLAEAISWLIAVLSGKQQYMVANDVAKSWKEADKAAGNYKKTILGFDEINRLDSPGGGGSGGGNVGDWFHYEDVNILKDLDGFFAAFRDDINMTIDALAELAAELLGLPDPTIELGFLDNVSEPLGGLVRTLDAFPMYASVVMSILGNPIPLIQQIREAVLELISGSPYKATVKVDVKDPSADLNKTKSSIQKAFEEITQTVTSWADEYEKAGERVGVRGQMDAENIWHFFENIRTYFDSFVNETLPAWSSGYETAMENASLRGQETANNIREFLDNVKQNMETFTSETLPAWKTWAGNVAENARLAFNNIAENVYAGLSNAADNIVSFINASALGIKDWVSGTATNIANWANNIVTNVATALKTAWNNFKSFLSATGEKISGWYNENKSWAVPLAVTAAITVGAIALAAPTGGASLGLLALANGGIVPNNGTLFVAGERGAEVVTQMGSHTGVTNVSQMQEAVAQGNSNVVGAVYAMADMIVSAINNKDMDIEMDGESVARILYRPMQQENYRRGDPLVVGGAFA